MHLLEPKQVQDQLRSEEAYRITRIGQLRDQEAKLRKDLIEAEAEFQRTLVKNRTDWEKEYEAHAREVKRMAAETEEAKARLLSFAVPYDILKEGDEGRIKKAKELLSLVQKQKSDNEERAELLQDKLEEVGDRELRVSDREGLVQAKEKHLELRAEKASQVDSNLAKAVADFNAKSEAKRQELKKRENSVEIAEKNIESQLKGIKAKESDFEAKERRLRDERGVLERAWNEFRRLTSEAKR